MIVPMDKVGVMVRRPDAEKTIQDLAALGLLHIEHQETPIGQGLTRIKDELALVEQALGILAKTEVAAAPKEASLPEYLSNWKILSHHITDDWKRIDQLQEYSRRLTQQFNEWKEWGDFDPHKLRALELKNVYVRFYRISVKEAQGFPKGAVVKTIRIKAGTGYYVVVSREKFPFQAKELEPPTMSLAQLQKRLKDSQRAIECLYDELRSCFCQKDKLLSVKQVLEKELEFQEALAGMGASGELTYIIGYAPKEQEARLMGEAKKHKWGILISQPQEKDSVPTLIRNPRWVSVIQPIFKFLEILPGYREMDISLAFLVFFSIFFGILIGDAGYGIAYILITFFLQQKTRRLHKDTRNFNLFYILGACAIIWGALTGTFFGHEWLMKAGHRPLLPALNDDRILQRFCFFLGALHLSIAHCWRALLKMPSLKALADVAWVLILWSAFFIARMLILGDSFPYFGRWLIIAGVLGVILFSEPEKNILKSIGKGLGTLALSLMNSFTDVVSYIRLFAVGMAGVAIADAFNAMASMIGSANILAVVFAGAIVVIGHALGIILGPVSVLVHGVRLNVLEFSGHANVSWSGIAYRPLTK